MKKILYLLALLFMGSTFIMAQTSTSCKKSDCCSPVSLKAVYDELAKLPGTVVKSYDDSIPIFKSDILKDGQFISQTPSDSVQIKLSTEKIYSLINNNLPMQYMISGANNQMSTALLYANPLGDGKYEFLEIDRVNNGVTNLFFYAITDEATINYLQNLPVEMQGNNLSIIQSVNGSNINWFTDWGNFPIPIPK